MKPGVDVIPAEVAAYHTPGLYGTVSCSCVARSCPKQHELNQAQGPWCHRETR